VLALLGAESTGKSTLGRDLAASLTADGHRALYVPEYLREFCDEHGRTPRREEQTHIAQVQCERIAAATRTHAWVIADTTSFMTALYSQWVFDDESLLAEAAAFQARVTLTLVTALDLPWVADGIQRDSPQAQRGIDQLLRSRLQAHALPFSVVSGLGGARLASARRAWQFALQVPAIDANAQRSTRTRWKHHCQYCDDPDCERAHVLGGWARSVQTPG
jgi:nicotinamide riboside kinase